MSGEEAKIYVSLKDGIFEICGSELFVTKQIDNFKESITKTLEILNSGIPALPPQEAPLPPAAPTLSPGSKSEHGFDKKSFPRVLHIDEKEVKIIKKIPGTNNAKKSVNTALVYLWGKRSIGVEDVSFQEIRDLCQHQGCLDSSNFSTHMKNAREHIIIDGKKGSSSKSCKLTLPGVELAEDLLRELNGV